VIWLTRRGGKLDIVDQENEMRAAGLLLFATMLTASAADAQALACHGAQKPREVVELLFGRNIGNRVGVSEADWARFVAREMTPRFPDGLTVSDAVGQWRDTKTGKVVHEPSKRVEIVLPGRGGDAGKLDAIVAAYKKQFHQQAVAVVVRSACVAFE
jgi:hypothetical protein